MTHVFDRRRRPTALAVACTALIVGAFAMVGRGAADSPDVIKFAHVPHVANDGRVAFSYHEDIWVAEADGSHAQRLTAHLANDFGPRFSPDGKWIAFTSNRTGNNDVFLVPSTGGEPRQLTYYSGDDQVLYWMPDGQSLLISSNRGPNAFGSPLYKLPINGAPPEPVMTASARLGMLKQDGSLLAYNRVLPSTGVWRKAFKGNSAPGLAVLDMKSGDIAEITNTDPHDYRNHVNDAYPMWGADGMLYFASERDGTYNVWRISPKGAGAQQVTHFKTGGVFYPAISPDGKKMVFQNEFDLWELDLPNGTPKKLSIPLSFDPKDNDIELLTTTNLAEGFSPSATGDEVAVDFHGDIHIVPSEQGVGEEAPVATTAWRERGEEYSPDGKRLAYISDESGDQEIWLFDIATRTRRKLTAQASEKSNIVWAPNSQKLVYGGDNKLWELDLSAATPAPREVGSNPAGGYTVSQYSADGGWLVYTRRDDDSNADVYLYDLGAKREFNVSHSPLNDANAALTPDGKTAVFLSNRDGGANQLFVVSLAKLTEDPNDPLVRERIRAATAAAGRGGAGGRGGNAPAVEAVAPSKIDLDGIEKRAIQITRGANAVSAFFLSPDGRTIYFATGAGGRGGRGATPATPARGRGAGGAAEDTGGAGLYAISLDGRDRRTVATGNFPGMRPTPDRRVVFFRSAPADGGRGGRGGAGGGAGQEIHKLTLAQATRQDRVSFTFQLRIDRREEWKQMFEDVWRTMKYRYYESSMNGYDWSSMKAKYEPMLTYAGTNEDVYDLGNAMIGEMSSSHTGVSGPPTHPMDRIYNTRFLGFEMAPWNGAYRITHVYRDGPADKEWLDVKTGDYVMAIDGKPLLLGDNYWKLLSTTEHEYIPVRLAKSPSGEGAHDVRIATVTNLGNIKYEEFVSNNRDIVEKATNNEIAYVHIRAMDQPSLERFQNEIDRYWNRKGIIIDVRFNTGGNIDEPLLDIIERRPYMFTNPRNGARTWGRRPQQAIAGPKVMLINQRSFSDGEATPMGFRTLNLGRLVGTPTAGGVIWTGSYSLINGGTVRTPSERAVVYDPTKPDNYGQNLENYGVPPDVWVQNSPTDETKNVDRELIGAIDEVMRMLKIMPGANQGGGSVK